MYNIEWSLYIVYGLDLSVLSIQPDGTDMYTIDMVCPPPPYFLTHTGYKTEKK